MDTTQTIPQPLPSHDDLTLRPATPPPVDEPDEVSSTSGNLLTFDDAAQAHDQEDQGFEFKLPYTKPGAVAYVKRIAFEDWTTMGNLPTHLQNRALQLLNQAKADAGGTLTVNTIGKDQKRDHEMANLVCRAGFITPRVMFTLAERTGDPNEVLIDHIHIKDRMAFLRLAWSVDVGSAERLIPFHRSETSHVGDVPTRQLDRNAVLGPLGTS
jgi:hypothetical protein